MVIIGAGSSGLASAAELGRAGIQDGRARGGRPSRVVVAAPLRPAAAELEPALLQAPEGPYPKGTGMFPSREEMVRYLERYSRSNGVDVRFGTRVERIDRDGHGWMLRTSAGDMAAGQVIVAGGYARRPFTPDWPGRESFRGRLLHAAEYRYRALPRPGRPRRRARLLGSRDRPHRRGRSAPGAPRCTHPAEHHPRADRPADGTADDEAPDPLGRRDHQAGAPPRDGRPERVRAARSRGGRVRRLERPRRRADDRRQE